MGELIDLRARLARRAADEDGHAARTRMAECMALAGGRDRLARLLTARLGWTVRPGHVAAWAASVVAPADVLLAAEAVAGRGRAGVAQRIAGAAARQGTDLRAVVGAFGPAVAADVVLRYAIDAPAADVDPAGHPLASCVLRRDVVDLLAWPLTGRAPAGLEDADPPQLEAGEREAFFAHCRDVVERAAARYRDPADPQPARQALYFAQWDPSPDTQAWVQDLERRERRRWRPRLGWTPRWVTARSSAITQARLGDLAPLRQFVARGLADDACQVADLNYWSAWVGEAHGTWASDEAMTGALHPAVGPTLMDRLASGIRAGDPLLDLNTASAAALVRRRPHLADKPAAARLRARAAATLAAPDLAPSTRRTLHALARA